MTAVLDTRMPAGLNMDGQTPDESRQYQTMQAARVQLLLMQRVPMRLPVYDWSIRSGINNVADRTPGVVVHLGALPSDHASRAAIMGLAEQFDLEYAEEPNGNGQNIVTAAGIYAGVPVKFLDLVEPCACGCGGGVR